MLKNNFIIKTTKLSFYIKDYHSTIDLTYDSAYDFSQNS